MISFIDTNNTPVSNKISWVNPLVNNAKMNKTNVTIIIISEPVSKYAFIGNPFYEQDTNVSTRPLIDTFVAQLRRCPIRRDSYLNRMLNPDFQGPNANIDERGLFCSGTSQRNQHRSSVSTECVVPPR
jgi:hypothetical protein